MHFGDHISLGYVSRSRRARSWRKIVFKIKWGVCVCPGFWILLLESLLWRWIQATEFHWKTADVSLLDGDMIPQSEVRSRWANGCWWTCQRWRKCICMVFLLGEEISWIQIYKKTYRAGSFLACMELHSDPCLSFQCWESQTFKIILSYIASLRPALDIWEPKQRNPQKYKTPELGK